MVHFGLKTRLLLLAILPTLVISILVAGYYGQSRSSELELALEEKGVAILERFSPLLYLKLYSLPKDQPAQKHLQTITNRIIELSDVRAATIFDQAGRQIVHAGPAMKGISVNPHEGNPNLSDRQRISQISNPKRESKEIRYSKQSVRFLAPILPFPEDGAEPLGWLEVEVSRDNLNLAKYELYITLGFIVLLGLIINGFLGLRLNRTITEPLVDIINAVSRVKEGHLDIRVHTNASGELHELELGINSMVESLKIAHEELKQSVDQATEDLRETLETIEIQNIELDLARKEALEASRIKSEFLANMSHEIRTPLNGIIGFTKLLLKSQATPRQLDYLSTIHRSSESLLAIINDILDFSKIEAGKLVLDYVPICLRDVIEEVITMVAPLAHEKQLEVISLVHNDVPPQLIGDPLRLKQVITNLVNNAIKFTESGFITLHTMLETSEENYSICKISITDTGIGLSKEDQSVIFKAFNQADTSAARRFGGTGLGLVISKHLVEQMGGEIGLQSTPGEGSTFWFRVRLDSSLSPNQPTPQTLKGKRVALFDFNPTTRLSIRHIVEQWGVETEEIEALEEVQPRVIVAETKERPFDAAIIGLSPQMTINQNLIMLLESLNKQQHCPTVVLANTSNQFPFEEGAEESDFAWLTKPVRSKQLFELLEKFLSPSEVTIDNQPMATPPATEPPQPHAIPSILCVDDNEANLKLIYLLLSELGTKVTACDSGIAALELLQNQSFDLIFMDIQMPRMDGIETTRRIRATEAREEKQTTIIALTAHALASEKQELLNAGMNDYITKPINESLLVEAIYKWTGYRAQFDHPPISSPTKTKQTVHYAPVVDLAEGIRLANGKVDLADDLLAMLLESLPSERATMIEKWEEGDFQSLLDHVHKLNGAARYCGVPALRTTVGHLETYLKKMMIKEVSHAEIVDAFKSLINEIDRLESWKKNWDRQSREGKEEKTAAPPFSIHEESQKY